jgi:heat-inducible transcriptional repressor
MLDERKTAILRAVVQEYIATAQPVGSTHVANAPGVKVSSATVRNEMAVLEQEGYLAQPHTSAGRIPTDKGYRFFVDHMGTPGRLEPVAQQQVGQFFDTTHGRLEELLHQTTNLLAQVTHHAAVVVGPRAETAVVRSVQVVSLSGRVATVVAVLSNGVVENETIELPAETSDVRRTCRRTWWAARSAWQACRPRAIASWTPCANSSPMHWLARTTKASSSVVHPRWRSPSTRWTRCGRCCARWSSNT